MAPCLWSWPANSINTREWMCRDGQCARYQYTARKLTHTNVRIRIIYNIMHNFLEAFNLILESRIN